MPKPEPVYHVVCNGAPFFECPDCGSTTLGSLCNGCAKIVCGCRGSRCYEGEQQDLADQKWECMQAEIRADMEAEDRAEREGGD